MAFHTNVLEASSGVPFPVGVGEGGTGGQGWGAAREALKERLRGRLRISDSILGSTSVL